METGQISQWRVLPASPNTGVVFLRQLENLKVIEIEAKHTNVLHSNGYVRLGNREVGVNGVEHPLAILHGTGITNAEILCENENPPENSFLFTQKLLRAKTFQREKIDYHYYSEYEFNWNNRSIRVERSDRLYISCEFTFDSIHVPNTLKYSIVVTPDSFRDKLSTARTFCTREYLDHLQDNYRALGVNEDNCIILPEDIEEGFKIDLSELVRHKVLDFIGDIFLGGKPVKGDFYLLNPNHTVSYLFHQELAQ